MMNITVEMLKSTIFYIFCTKVSVVNLLILMKYFGI